MPTFVGVLMLEPFGGFASVRISTKTTIQEGNISKKLWQPVRMTAG